MGLASEDDIRMHVGRRGICVWARHDVLGIGVMWKGDENDKICILQRNLEVVP